MTRGIIKTVLDILPENNRLERIWKLAQIDFMKRYYNDRLGLFWALLNPLFQIIVYFVVFTQILENPQDDYVLFLSCGILFWSLFTEVARGGMALIRTKIYLIESIQFDKLDLFISHALSVVMAFVFNLFVYILIAIALGANINENILYIIPILVSFLLLSVAFSILLSVVVLFVDDIKHLWDMITFIAFWGSGVIVSMDSFVEKMPSLVYINPFISILENCRNALLYGIRPDFPTFIYSSLISILLFILAVFLFRRSEHLILEKL